MCLGTKEGFILHSHGCDTYARAHVQMCPLFRISETAGRIVLKFGMWIETDCPGLLQKARVRHGCTCTPSFSFLGNGGTDCAELRYLVKDPLARRFTYVTAGYRCTRVRAHSPFPYPGNDWADALKFDLWLGDY